jgi:5'-methylthioadenosine phosphorylase
MAGLQAVRRVEVKTPFGKPSDKLVRGRIGSVEWFFYRATASATAGLPTEINFRANIFAMKKLGVERIISDSAVGSLRAEIAPWSLGHPRSVHRSHYPAAQHVFW